MLQKMSDKVNMLKAASVAIMWFVILVIINVILPCVLGEESQSGDGTHWMDFWVVRLLLNLLGYATIFVPGYLLMRYLRNIRYNETAAPSFLSNLIKHCVFGNDDKVSLESAEEGGESPSGTEESQNPMKRGFTLVFCLVGLQGAYLTWGVLQERIMTFEYGKEDGQGEFFKNSQFLVFINRILAFIIGMTVIFFRRQPHHTTPLYNYSFSSFSNIMSSWCQYEALKFVSFPTQILAKASKVIPVMLMGKVVSKRTYQYHEYITAGMISVGVTLFLLNSGDVTRHKGSVTTISGVILLAGYMAFDSFTSNWQGELFKRHKVSSIQMMTGVNMFSCLLTGVSLLEQGGFFDSFAFMARHHLFVVHAIVLSLCSAGGQLFIFYTISQFGAVTFTIIMTLRQAFAILLSCVIYGHPVTFIALIGIVIVFVALFLRIYANQKKKSQKPTGSTTTTSKV
ncbi:solute carrier family 35 (adenosine 3'-phospho 5'-phosphosulfate transporter), member B2 [Mytilus galloprovincialis]|uniref:Adenosine 3'-phospho 5'-phosphosulfate transporter 1 n=2 Tax=Mytilus galloprovincialis TaxID=29158 RepID=A0A8B6G257_MYTGA|nr:solute carrier family 35 (adenosine 3'-phospho 5'-phosphosulfate transporter), member B2 [Mytilus galloprovincialis]